MQVQFSFYGQLWDIFMQNISKVWKYFPFSAKTYALRVEHSDERQQNMHQGEPGLKCDPFHSYI